MSRICGCRDDTIQTKIELLQQWKKTKIPINDDGKTIHIGVIFHICYRNYQTAVVVEDVGYTIDLLNKDFNKQCPNFNIGANVYKDPILKETYEKYLSVAQGCNIQFYKVNIIYKPIGTQTSMNISVLDQNIKYRSPPIEPSRYLNIWVVDFSNGLLGYSQFPWDQSPNTDGVVIARGTFGKNPTYSAFNLGKTLTHEIGHWLGLYHTFQETFNYKGGNIDYQDGSPEEEIQETKGDCIADTPPQAVPTTGNPFANPSFWPKSRPRDEDKEHYHMFMNFMDYSDDIALFMFTQDQAAKMRLMIHLYRPGILSSHTSNPPPTPTPVSDVIAHYNFEDFSGNWVGRLILYNALNYNAQVTTLTPYQGTRCLRTRRWGRGQLRINLFNVQGVVKLSMFIKAIHPDTRIWLRPPRQARFYVVNIPVNQDHSPKGRDSRSTGDDGYKQYLVTLPRPYSFHLSDYYTIMFGTNGQSSNYSYFDEIKILNDPSNTIKSQASNLDIHDYTEGEIQLENSNLRKSIAENIKEQISEEINTEITDLKDIIKDTVVKMITEQIKEDVIEEIREEIEGINGEEIIGEEVGGEKIGGAEINEINSQNTEIDVAPLLQVE